MRNNVLILRLLLKPIRCLDAREFSHVITADDQNGGFCAHLCLTAKSVKKSVSKTGQNLWAEMNNNSHSKVA